MVSAGKCLQSPLEGSSYYYAQAPCFGSVSRDTCVRPVGCLPPLRSSRLSVAAPPVDSGLVVVFKTIFGARETSTFLTSSVLML